MIPTTMPEREAPASMINHASMIAENRRVMLGRDPLLLDETIAEYHASIATTAIQLRHMLEQARYYPDARTPDFNRAIAMLKEQIADYYFNAFGVRPSWEVLPLKYGHE